MHVKSALHGNHLCLLNSTPKFITLDFLFVAERTRIASPLGYFSDVTL